MKADQRKIADDIGPTGTVVIIAILVGLLFAALQHFSAAGSVPGRPPFAAVLWSLACLIAGGFIGFLFGIPRILQSDTAANAAASAPAGPSPPKGGAVAGQQVPSNYRPNTNLDQISEWLTKIIVGLGLVNLQKVPDQLNKASGFISQSLGGPEYKFFAGAIIVYFSLVGLLGTYLITRIYLSKIFERADVGRLGLAEIIPESEKQTLARSDLTNPERPNLTDAEETIARKILDVPLESLASASDISAWSKAQFNARNYEKAVEGYRRAAELDLADPQTRLEFANALFYLGRSVTDEATRKKLRDEAEQQLLRAYQLVQNSNSPELRMKAYRALTFHYLYDPPPDGFSKTIKYGTEYRELDDPRKIQSGGLLVNLACAYSQKYMALKNKGEADLQTLCAARDEAYRVAAEALDIDKHQIWLKRLRQLLQKGAEKDPADNDLEIFEKDNKFRRLLSLPEVPPAEDSGKDCPDSGAPAQQPGGEQ